MTTAATTVDAISATLLTAISIAWTPVTHNGMMTCHNTASGGHKTFRIFTVGPKHIQRAERLRDRRPSVRRNERARFPEYMLGKRVAQVLTGPDRGTFGDWFTFGFVGTEGVKVFRNLQGPKGQPSNYDWAAKLMNDRAFGAARGVHYHIEGRCSKCNRPLTHPSSLYPGIGPVCRGEANTRVAVDYTGMSPELTEAVKAYETALASPEGPSAAYSARDRVEELLSLD